MANEIKIKRSAVQGKVPTTSDLALGELAINTYDGKLYTKKDDGVASVVQIGDNPTLFFNITSTAGQTVYTGLTYNPGALLVFLDGIFLDPDMYTATNGTSLTLVGIAAEVGDELVVVAVGALTIATLTNVNLIAVTESEKTDHDATSGGTITLDYANGNNQVITADGTAYTIAKGTWPTGVTASMLLYIKQSGTDGTIPTVTWSSWSFKNTPPPLDGLTANTGWALVEITQIAGDMFAHLVEEA